MMNIRDAMHVSLFIAMLFIVTVKHVTAHGGMLEPPMRSIMWRYGFETPVNYDWMALYCGGLHTFQQNRGKCGLCGDNFKGPFENDKGGMYDNGIIVRHYPPGVGEIDIKVELTAHHKGYFTFKLCPNNERQLTHGCLNRYPLRIREARQAGGNPFRYYPPVLPKLNELHVELPADVTCDRCVLQWTYRAGNSNGQAPNGTNCIGCGIQETFVNCADVSIGGSRDTIPVTKDNSQSAQTTGPDIEIPSQNAVTSIINNPETTFQDMMQALEPNVADTRTQGQTQGRTPVQIPRLTHRQQENTSPTRRDEHPNVRGSRRNNVPNRANNLLDPSGINLDLLRRQLAIKLANIAVQRGRGQGHHGRLPTPPQQPSVDRHERLRQHSLSRDNSIFPPNRIPSNIPNNRVEHTQNGLRPPSTMGGSHGGVINMGGNSRGMSLLDTLNPLVNEIRNRNRLRNRHSNVGAKRSSPKTLGVDIFGNRLPQFPRNVNFLRGDGMSSQRDAVRHSPHLDRFQFSTTNIREIVPELPRNIGPRQDTSSSRTNRRSSNWFPDANMRLRQSRMRQRQSMTSQAQSRLPRRITVHSMGVAQHLLRKWPQLKGRVFLSRRAHVRNQHAHMMHKYSRRQRWQ